MDGSSYYGELMGCYSSGRPSRSWKRQRRGPGWQKMLCVVEEQRFQGKDDDFASLGREMCLPRNCRYFSTVFFVNNPNPLCHPQFSVLFPSHELRSPTFIATCPTSNFTSGKLGEEQLFPIISHHSL